MSQPSSDSFIQTYSGRKFDFRNPDPESITLEDIAHVLSRIQRFGGHTIRPYSVADDSVNVARIVAWKDVTKDTLCAALLHDASECYTGDIVTPFKRMLPQAMELEKKLCAIILQKFGVDETKVDFAAIKLADETMLVWEANTLFDFPPLDNWTSSIPIEPTCTTPTISLNAKEAEVRFLAVAQLLLPQFDGR